MIFEKIYFEVQAAIPATCAHERQMYTKSYIWDYMPTLNTILENCRY